MSTFTTDKVACTAHKTTRTTKKPHTFTTDKLEFFYRNMYWLQPNLHTIISIYYKSTFTAEFTQRQTNLHVLKTICIYYKQ